MAGPPGVRMGFRDLINFPVLSNGRGCGAGYTDWPIILALPGPSAPPHYAENVTRVLSVNIIVFHSHFLSPLMFESERITFLPEIILS